MKTRKMSCEFLVCGGGYAGICAAVQGARLGMKTLLVERAMILGGNGGPLLGVGATGCMNCNPFWNETGVIEELEQRVNFRGARIFPTNFGYNIHPMWDEVVSDMLDEAGATVLRGYLVIDAGVSDGRIRTVTAVNIETLDRLVIEVTGYVVDDTGEAHVAHLSGALCMVGRESREWAGERSAPDQPDGILSAASVTALVVDSGRPCVFTPPPGTPPWNPNKPDNHFDPAKAIHFLWQVDEGGEDPGNNSMESPQQLYKRLTYRIYSVWHYLKNIKYPEAAKNFQLVWISPILGRREGRRILGDYVLTQTDIESVRAFDDAAGFGGHMLDEHLPSYDGGYEVRFYSRPLPYDIPLRCLYSKNIANLLSAGRAISASHLAFTTTRLMRTGGQLGQAAAVCARMCLDTGRSPRDIAVRHPREFRRALLRNDGFTIGCADDGPGSPLRGACARASSQATLTLPPDSAGARWETAGGLLGAWLHQMPGSVETVRFHIRNTGSSPVTATAILGYGESEPVRFFPVPPVHYDEKLGRYVEQEPDGMTGAAPDAVFEAPTGSEGCRHYSSRDDVIRTFTELARRERIIEPGFEGDVAFCFAFTGPFPARDRTRWAQAALVAVCGDVEVMTVPVTADVVEGTRMTGAGLTGDAARTPVVRITPELTPGSAENLLDGHIHREGRAHLHQWMSAPDAPLPQWAAVTLPAERRLSRVSLHFDVTERLWRDMYPLKGQPAAGRLVRHYTVEVLSGADWHVIAEERDNYLRFRRHELKNPMDCRGVRVTVHGVWGGGPARIYHIGLE